MKRIYNGKAKVHRVNRKESKCLSVSKGNGNNLQNCYFLANLKKKFQIHLILSCNKFSTTFFSIVVIFNCACDQHEITRI